MSTAILDSPRASASNESLYEVVHGFRVEQSPMSTYAAFVASNLTIELGHFVNAHRLGRVVTEGLFLLDAEDDLRRRPDLAFLSAAKWPLDRRLPETGDWEVTPDLPIEVVSPTDTVSELYPKIGEYFQYGARCVWVIVPEVRQVHCFSAPNRVRILEADEDLTEETLLPGFRLRVANLFQPPDTTG